jgi:hypothetical protein
VCSKPHSYGPALDPTFSGFSQTSNDDASFADGERCTFLDLARLPCADHAEPRGRDGGAFSGVEIDGGDGDGAEVSACE